MLPVATKAKAAPAAPETPSPQRTTQPPAITLGDLPPPDTTRWVTRRKAEVVAGVRAGLLTLEEACARYSLSREEYLSWEHLIDRHGVRGLRVTRIQQYRSKDAGGKS